MDFSTQKLTKMGLVLSKNLDPKYTKYFYDIYQSLDIDAEFSMKLKKSCIYCLAGDQTISQRNKIHKRTFMMPISIIAKAKQKLQKTNDAQSTEYLQFNSQSLSISELNRSVLETDFNNMLFTNHQVSPRVILDGTRFNQKSSEIIQEVENSSEEMSREAGSFGEQSSVMLDDSIK